MAERATGGVAARVLAAATFAVAASGVATQAVLTGSTYLDEGRSLAAAMWRLAGFFTIWTNLSVAAVAAAHALGTGPLAGVRARIAVLPAILVVGASYTVLLRPLIDEPAPVQAVVSSLLHDVSPLLFLALVVAAGGARVPFAAFGVALILPGAYFAAAIVRGAVTGWYPYWFLDPADVGPLGLARSAALLAAAFVILGGALVAAMRWRA